MTPRRSDTFFRTMRRTVHHRSSFLSQIFATIVTLGLATGSGARAEVRASALIGDHMVVQRDRPVRLWGTAARGESVTVSLGGRTSTTRADSSGRWLLTGPALAAGGPFVLTIEGSNKLTFSDVWAGEVWVASGQSNMAMALSRSMGADQAVAGGCPGLRLFTVIRSTAVAPRADVEGSWEMCDARTAGSFSATAYHFGREINRTLGVVVGLIHASWGGTPAESWTPREALMADPALKRSVDVFEMALSDANVRAEAERKVADWEAKNFHHDTGNRGEARGFARTPRTAGGRGVEGGSAGKGKKAAAGWTQIQLPKFWEDAGLNIDGAVWFRREVVLPEEWAGADLSLSLGPIDDFDVTYWNGERVGATGKERPHYWSVPRRYSVPGRLAKAGRNVIAVRVFDHFGTGGFGGAAPQMSIGHGEGSGAAVPLAGVWEYKVERRLEPVVADFASRPSSAASTDDPNGPSLLWNAMVAPLARFPIAGAIWYQGESNAGRGPPYRPLFAAMIRAWRAAWELPTLPFVFVQLPNFDAARPGTPPVSGESTWAELREAQAAALQLPKTAMAVTLDIGDPRDIHPSNKQEVGRRLALAASNVAYGKDVIASGPSLRTATREGAAFRVRFTGVAGGLMTSDGGAPRGFMLASADRLWRAADARIEGDSVVVWHPLIPEPVAVRYGWGDDPPNTLRNQAGLPAAPFRTDAWAGAGAVGETSRRGGGADRRSP